MLNTGAVCRRCHKAKPWISATPFGEDATDRDGLCADCLTELAAEDEKTFEQVTAAPAEAAPNIKHFPVVSLTPDQFVMVRLDKSGDLVVSSSIADKRQVIRMLVAVAEVLARDV